VARTIVLRKLAAQARTRAELSRALQAKQVPTQAAEAVLDRMEAIGLIDDQGFARDWVESRQQRRNLSKTALRRELTAKGVDREQIDSALEEVDADDELTAARSLAAKKARAMAGLDVQVRYRRLAGVLGRRGFNPGVINQVVNEVVRPIDDGPTDE
jgi:regulatory protein